MPTVEKYRPRFHFTPPQNWMNDPNGLVYDQGEYHLYYQHNPYGTAWGHMSWGHAVSPNLVHWTHLPVAITEVPTQGYTIFSGSAVVDADNTSGLGAPGKPPLVAVFTADYRGERGLEDVHIAYSTDRGRTYTEYVGNPVIHVGNAKFGDPKVFWHVATHRWIMVTILGTQQGCVVIYGSPDLLHWARLSAFEAPEEAPGVWECPDLFPLALDGDPAQERWVLKTNCVGTGHATRYWVGAFDGVTFRATQPALRPRPEDDSFYAEVTYNHLPDAGRRLMFGWLRQAPRPGRVWTGAQSAPRELTLCSTPEGTVLCQAPATELQYLRRGHWALGDQLVLPEMPLALPPLSWKSECEMVIELDLQDATGVGLRLAADDGRQIIVGYDRAAGELYLDGAHPERLAVACAVQGRLRLHLLLDRSIIEVFAEDGRATLSAILDEDALFLGGSLFAQGGQARLAHLDGWGLDSAILITDW